MARSLVTTTRLAAVKLGLGLASSEQRHSNQLVQFRWYALMTHRPIVKDQVAYSRRWTFWRPRIARSAPRTSCRRYQSDSVPSYALSAPRYCRHPAHNAPTCYCQRSLLGRAGRGSPTFWLLWAAPISGPPTFLGDVNFFFLYTAIMTGENLQ